MERLDGFLHGRINRAYVNKAKAYIQILLNPDWDDKDAKEIAEHLKVSEQAICRWGRRVDWDWVKETRRKAHSRQTVGVDKALHKKALKGDTSAISLWYERIEGWIPRSMVDQNTKHQIDEADIDNALKELLYVKSDTANALRASAEESKPSADEAGKSPADEKGLAT